MAKVKDRFSPRLQERYKKEIIPSMVKKFGYKNTMQVPKLEKISLNMGVGEATQDAKFLDAAIVDLTAIAASRNFAS